MLLAAPATASEMIGPLDPPPMPARQPLAPVAGEHARPRVCNACRGHCQGGTCPANCPVRPDEFGFYETQWRSWPSATNQKAVTPETLTPASPPKSEVPGAEEESLPQPAFTEEDAEAEAAAPLPIPRIAVPDRRPSTESDKKPSAEAAEPLTPSPESQAPEAEPAAEPAVPEKEPPAAPAKEENLFDEARRLPRAAVLAIASQKAARSRSAAPTKPPRESAGLALVGHEEADAPRSDHRGNRLRVPAFQSRNPLREPAAD
jgi:hypothetical protein